MSLVAILRTSAPGIRSKLEAARDGPVTERPGRTVGIPVAFHPCVGTGAEVQSSTRNRAEEAMTRSVRGGAVAGLCAALAMFATAFVPILPSLQSIVYLLAARR